MPLFKLEEMYVDTICYAWRKLDIPTRYKYSLKTHPIRASAELGVTRVLRCLLLSLITPRVG
ncbi:hypothetical protein J6590_027302 [Homalodisca vitripennis]|nr:hypothetical protein J6590_027302 [Homalodisca vitripennis]